MTDPAVKVLDLQRFWLALGLLLAFAACMAFLLLRAVPEENKDIVVYMAGQLSGLAAMALAFYFTKNAGQDAQDAKKTENTGRALEAIAAASSSPQDVRVVNPPDEAVPVEPTGR